MIVGYSRRYPTSSGVDGLIIDFLTERANFAFPQTLTVHDGYLYAIPCEASDAQLNRYPLDDYTAVEELTIPMLANPGNNADFWCSVADGNYLYLYPGGNLSGGKTQSVLRRIDLTNFATIATLNPGVALGGTNVSPSQSETGAGKIVVLGTWLYLPNVQGGSAGGSNGPSLVRVSTDLTTVQSIATLGSGAVRVGTYDCFTDGTYVYAIGQSFNGESGYYLYRINPATFTLVDRLLLNATPTLTPIGTASGGFAYIIDPDGTLMYRIDLSTFSAVETLDMSGSVTLTFGVSDIFVAGDYVYTADRGLGTGWIAGVDRNAATWSNAAITVKYTTDYPLIVPATKDTGFSALACDGNALYGALGDFNNLHLVKIRLFDGDAFTEPAGRANDDFANAIALTLNVPATGSNAPNFTANGYRYCTAEAGEPDHPGENGYESEWWKWVATATGTFNVDLFGSVDNDWGWSVGVYTGADVASLTEVAFGADWPVPAPIPFAATLGETYYFQIDGWGGGHGAIQIEITP